MLLKLYFSRVLKKYSGKASMFRHIELTMGLRSNYNLSYQ